MNVNYKILFKTYLKEKNDFDVHYLRSPQRHSFYNGRNYASLLLPDINRGRDIFCFDFVYFHI